MTLNKNNNNGVVKRLALSSIKSNKMRNVFIVITIALSVSLLMVLSLLTFGISTANRRLASKTQHAIYHHVSEEQSAALVSDSRIKMLIRIKNGTGMVVDKKWIIPVWNELDATKGNIDEVNGYQLTKGEFPRAFNEIAISNGYCQMLGVEAETGTKVAISFLDGTREEFVITGILDIPEITEMQPIFFSEPYAMEGKQLKDIDCDALVRFNGVEGMSQNQFVEEVYDIGEKSGILRKNINENGAFKYSLSGGEQQVNQLITTVVICLGILFVSVLVIYSVFYLSVISRIKQFGQLRTIGMSRKQIRKMITREGLLLSSMGIPAGLLIGGTIGYFLNPQGWDWKTTLIVGVVVIIADLITVSLSIHKPAKIASTISPIEAASYSGYSEKNTKSSVKQLHRSLSTLNLAKINAVRNRKKTILTLLSLSVGGILFLVASTFTTAISLEEYSRLGPFEYGEFIVSLSYNATQSAKGGITELQMSNPLDEELKTKILNIDGVKEIYPDRKALGAYEVNGRMETEYVYGFSDGEIHSFYLTEGSLDYSYMMEHNGILICGNESLENILGWKFKIGDTIDFTFSDGIREMTEEFTVVGFLDPDYRNETLNAGWFMIPAPILERVTSGINLTQDLIVSTEEGKEEQIEAELLELLSEEPILSLETLRENKALYSASYSIAFAMILGLCSFIIGFSLINLINTLITNILTKKQEYAMLQSIGMTNKQLSKMIQAEGMLLSLGNIIITLLVGTPLAYGLIRYMKSAGLNYVHFNFPIWHVLTYVIIMLVVPFVISNFALAMVKKQTLVERLRVVD